jgi:aquaporin NIP
MVVIHAPGFWHLDAYCRAISGAAMSPMRSLGPALVANKYDNVWIYLIAPPIGALAGTWTHSLLQITS